jgi:nucleotide-binding universal stress UspA family protein
MACALARQEQTRLLVLHVIDEVHVFEETVLFAELGIETPISAVGCGDRETLKERLREVYAPRQPIDVVYCTRQGDVAEEILRMASEVSSDLIVVGTHGRAGLDRLLTGSVAEAVMRRAPCAVLSVRSNRACDCPKARQQELIPISR